MEARLIRAALLAACTLSLGASHRTQNFVVSSPSQSLSREVCEAAEAYRRKLAVEWLGRELAPWQGPCPITVHVGDHLGAGGATSFMFDDNDRPFGWSMTIQGSRERILDSVLPHEVTHTVFATHFGGPLPRWADEGACTTVEHESEKDKQKRLLIEFLTTGRGIAFNRMFAMKRYPPDILPLYAQGYSLARYLIAQGGKQKFIQYVGDGMKSNNWPQTTLDHYGFQDLSELQLTWLDWVRQGSPPGLASQGTVLAQQSSPPIRREGSPAAVRTASAEPSSGVTKLAGQPAPSTPADRRGGGGWYARVRDEARAKPAPATSPAVRPAADPERASSQAAVAGQSVSRPQPVGRPGQVILEWSRESKPAPAYPLQQQRKSAGGSYLVGPDVLKNTILR